MNKIMLLLLSSTSFFIGLEIIVLKKLPIGLGYHNAGYLSIGNFAYMVGGIFIIFGLFSFYLLLKEFKKPKISKHTKCPKCQETFNYKDTINGKCPHCKDMDTIDIKEYYEKFPSVKDI